jgi:hypothetical protein
LVKLLDSVAVGWCGEVAVEAMLAEQRGAAGDTFRGAWESSWWVLLPLL